MILVGVPVYNTEIRQFKACLYSILAQTKKVHILVVDDCSKEELSNQYKNFCEVNGITYVRQNENMGVSAARNVVIDKAKEPFKYLSFVDSDDVLLPNFAEVTEEIALKNDVDILSTEIHQEGICRAEDSYIKNGENASWVHGKLYKITFLKEHNIRFPEHIRVCEDVAFNISLMFLTKKYQYFNKCFYIWRNYKESLTRKDNDGTNKVFFDRSNEEILLGQIAILDNVFDKVEHKSDLGNCVVTIYHACQRQILLTGKPFELGRITVQRIKEIVEDKTDRRYFHNFHSDYYDKLHPQSPYVWLMELGVDANV